MIQDFFPGEEEGGLRIALGVLFGAAFLLFAVLTGIFANMYCAFSYHGKKQVSKRVIEGIAQYVALSDGGKGLDVGCGSGALTIACAKRNPRAQMVGIGRPSRPKGAGQRRRQMTGQRLRVRLAILRLHRHAGADRDGTADFRQGFVQSVQHRPIGFDRRSFLLQMHFGKVRSRSAPDRDAQSRNGVEQIGKGIRIHDDTSQDPCSHH